jgi:DNA-binding PadR family transcriptional regulator
MMEDIRRFAGVSLGPGTLYGAISRLEARGWIRPTRATDRRQPYTLAAAGRCHLAEQLDSLGRFVTAGRERLGHA